MINKTVAFSNSGGFWKSRYSFISSCFGFLDKLFFSSPTRSYNGEICWEHNKRQVPRNKFYGGIPVSSSLSVTFNQNPSSNKIYKSFSLEGTSNMSGLNSVIVNNSSDDTQRKNATISFLEEKGGIMYGNVASIQKVTGTNIKPIGIINNITGGTDGEFTIRMRSFLSNNPLPASGDAKLFVIKNSEAEVFFRTGNAYTPALANQIVSEVVEDQEVTINPAVNLFSLNTNFNSDVPFEDYLTLGDLSFDENNSFKDGNDIFISFDENNNTHAPSLGTPQAGAEDYLFHTPLPTNFQTFYEDDTYVLCSITPASTSGDNPKGQYADAVVTLGSDDFELYALNLEYEGTQYDHSLKLRKRAQQAQGQKTKST